MPCNSCGGRAAVATEKGATVSDLGLMEDRNMTDQNSELVVWIDPNVHGMMHYWASVSRKTYPVWKLGQAVRIYKVDREEFEGLGYIAPAGT